MPDFSILQPVNFAGAALAGYQAGRAIRQDNEREGALQGYLANPEDDVSISRLAAADPSLGIPLMERRKKAARDKQVGELAARAAQGDEQAAIELWQLDTELASRFDDRSRKQIEEGTKAIGNAAYRIALLPEDQQPAAWDMAVDALAPTYPGVGKYKGQYSPENLNALLDQTGMSEKVIEARRPRYQAVAPGGSIQNTNPLAGPVGMMGQPRGGDPNLPQPGTVEDGYRFRGGDPADPSNWEAVGGPTGARSGGFR
jgi:hypothetical protein